MWCGVRSLSRVLALDGAPALQVAWLDGHVSRFHLAWLRDHCPSRVDTATGQRIGRFSDLQVHPTLLEFAVHPPPSVEGSSQGPTLWLRWEAEQESRFPLQWLRQNCYVDFHSEEARKKRQPSRWTNPHSLPSFLYADVTQNPARLLQFMHTVADVGVCLLKDVPLVEGQVEEVARLVDQPMNTIYEHPFNVVSEENPINLAYTSQRLDLHQDLAYYESPPGMQLLHVLQFDESVHGGESTFLDGFALAEYMREVYPQSFQDLCRIPLTLHKDHMHRSNPVRMEYMRTVFEVNGDGDVIRFSWAPVFEGVLRAPERHVMAYYRARADLCQALQQCVEGGDDPRLPTFIKVRLQPGDLVFFNNRRMLHGREAFGGGAPGAKRHLQGTYLHIDHFLSKMRVLEYQHDQQQHERPTSAPPQSWARLGNGSWH